MADRSAKSGQYVTPAEAAAHPDVTVHETRLHGPPPAAVAKRLASYADRGSGTDMPGEAYSEDPDFWNLEAARLNDWLHG